MSENLSERPHRLSPLERIAATVRAHRLRKGWSPGELARRAGVSRTTLHHLERAETSRPQAAILRRIAEALELPADWLEDRAGASRKRAGASPREALSAPDLPSPAPAPREAFDRATNPLIEEVAEDRPELFRGWSDAEWRELYSSFGAGGALTREGVIESARRIDRRRATLRKLEVVLDTHLEEVAEGLVDALYRMLDPTAGGIRSAECGVGNRLSAECGVGNRLSAECGVRSAE
ncbi:MAG: helix-turn-helix transcriptional regulator [Planctomycetales bacterium]